MAETGCHRVTCNKPDTGKSVACDLPHVRAMKVDLVKAESRRVVTKDWAGREWEGGIKSTSRHRYIKDWRKEFCLLYRMLLICNQSILCIFKRPEERMDSECFQFKVTIVSVCMLCI